MTPIKKDRGKHTDKICDPEHNTLGMAVFLFFVGFALIGSMLSEEFRSLFWFVDLVLLAGYSLWMFVRCRRYHCIFTGPFYLALAVLVFISSLGVFYLPPLALWSGFLLGTGLAFFVEWIHGFHLPYNNK